MEVTWQCTLRPAGPVGLWASASRGQGGGAHEGRGRFQQWKEQCERSSGWGKEGTEAPAGQVGKGDKQGTC